MLLQTVVRGLKQNEQNKVDQMAADIEVAVKGLKEKQPQTITVVITITTQTITRIIIQTITQAITRVKMQEAQRWIKTI